MEKVLKPEGFKTKFGEDSVRVWADMIVSQTLEAPRVLTKYTSNDAPAPGPKVVCSSWPIFSFLSSPAGSHADLLSIFHHGSDHRADLTG
jgi:hypothetical protein